MDKATIYRFIIMEFLGTLCLIGGGLFYNIYMLLIGAVVWYVTIELIKINVSIEIASGGKKHG